MKYGATIQDQAARGHNWRYYDENFRFLRQSQATSLPWGTIHWELWLKSQINANKSIRATSVAKNLDVPRGYYLKFHKKCHHSMTNAQDALLSTHVLNVMVHIGL